LKDMFFGVGIFLIYGFSLLFVGAFMLGLMAFSTVFFLPMEIYREIKKRYELRQS